MLTRWLSKARDATADAVKSLEDSATRPAVVRDAQVWAESEIKEVEQVRDQLNAYMLMRNRAARADLIAGGVNASAYTAALAKTPRLSGESAKDHEQRVRAATASVEPPPLPTTGRWAKQHAEAQRLTEKGVVLDKETYAAMERELDRREAADAVALKETNSDV